MNKKFSIALAIIFSIFYLVVPIIPDIQIVRPKLFVIEILTFLLLAMFLFSVIIESKFFYNNSPIFISVFLMLAYIILQYVFSVDKSLSFIELKRWLLSFVLLFLISVLENKFYKLIIMSWILGTGLAILYGYLQHTGGVWILQVPQMDRVMSMFGNPIFFAVHIIGFVPILIGTIAVYEKNKIVSLKKLLLIGLLVLSLFTLYYTKTRAAYIGFIVSICIFIFLSVSAKKKYLYLTIIFIGTIFFIFLTKNIWYRQQAHLLIWQDTIKMWVKRPLFGVGLGRFHIEFVSFASEQLRQIWPQKNFIINDAHNEYLQILSETGIVGLVLFFLILGTFFYSVINKFCLVENESLKDKYLKKQISKSNCVHKGEYFFTKKVFINGLLSSIVAIFVQNIFSVDMRFVISSVYFFLTIGLVCGIMFEVKYLELNFLNNKYVKTIFIIIIVLFLGIVSIDFSNFKLSLVNYVHITSNGVKFGVEDSGNGILQYILRPYIAEHKLKHQPDFFDEKILDKEKTLQELLELQKKFPTKSIIYEKIAWIYAKEKQFDKAIENYLLAIKYNPSSFGSYNNLGNIMFLLGRRQDAINAYKMSIEINPSQADARLNLGILYYYEGQLNLAAEQFNKVLELDPKNEKALIMLKKMRE